VFGGRGRREDIEHEVRRGRYGACDNASVGKRAVVLVGGSERTCASADRLRGLDAQREFRRITGYRDLATLAIATERHAALALTNTPFSEYVSSWTVLRLRRTSVCLADRRIVTHTTQRTTLGPIAGGPSTTIRTSCSRAISCPITPSRTTSSPTLSGRDRGDWAVLV
jgi:hypothetical protein